MKRIGSIKVFLVLVTILLLFMVGCATFQEQWNKLTPDQKARIIVNDIQTQLNTLFDTGKAYVATKPQYQAKWKAEIVPAFDVANKTLAGVISLAQSGQITPDQVYAKLQPVLASVLNLLVSIGAVTKAEADEILIKPIYGLHPTPQHAAMDAMLILALINGLIQLALTLWSSARKVFGQEVIPEWDEIVEKNKQLQAKIDAEMQS